MVPEMNDREYMLHAFRGDLDAIRLIDDLRLIAGVWDDLYDGDKGLTKEQISKAFWAATVSIPSNPFYLRFASDLRPVMAVGIINWQIANEYEHGLHEERVLAHVLRYSIADVATLIAMLIGGPEWVAAVGPELRRRSQKDTLQHYLGELEARNGQATAA